MTKLNADWLTSEGSKAVTGMLTDAGFEVYFVGGCVRNALVDMYVADLDLATNARPDVVMKLAQDAGLKVIPTGIDHGTVTVVSDHRPYEITTYRTDVETDGRHAVVAFSDTLKDDAIRRDFTMNALYCAPDGTVIDPVGGIPDLRANHVRFINDPHERIREDYLRILRFFRFYAWFGDPAQGLDAEGLAACAANLDGLASLSKQRVQTEIVKTLQADNPAPAMSSMAISGVLLRLLPGVDPAPLAPLVHLEQSLGRSAQWHTRLAAINSNDVSKRLRLSKADTMKIIRIYKIGANRAIEALMLREVLMEQRVTQTAIDAVHFATLQVFPIKAKDVMPAYQGREIGKRLKHLEEVWIKSTFAMSKADLLAQP